MKKILVALSLCLLLTSMNPAPPKSKAPQDAATDAYNKRKKEQKEREEKWRKEAKKRQAAQRNKIKAPHLL